MRLESLLNRCLILLIFLFGIASISACKKDNSLEVPSSIEESNATTDEHNILVVYFTWSNNTKQMANYIYGKIGGSIYEIAPVTPYPTTSYTQWGNLARDERDNDARPAIKNPLSKDAIAQYDTILLGFPIWWHTAPMIIGTFLESYNWTANTNIYPFFQGASNSNNEYYNNSMSFIRRCSQGATIHEGLYTAYSNTSRINEYLTQNGLI